MSTNTGKVEALFKLHDYQEYCVNFLHAHDQNLLLLEPGLGKTLISLMYLSDLKMLGNLGKVLVIAPLNVAKYTWSGEIDKWDFDLTYSLILGTQKQRDNALKVDADIYITNKENVVWLIENIPEWDFDTLIIDELSAFKAPDTKRFKALKSVRNKIKTFVGLTGTPAPNSLLDLWPQVYLADMGERLGKFKTRYKQSYFQLKRFNADPRFESSYEVRPGAEEKIYEKISDIAVSMKSKDHLKLPPRIDNKVMVPLSKKHRKMYETYVEDKVLELPDGELTALSAAVLANKLLQFANGSIYRDPLPGSDDKREVVQIHNGKIEALQNIIEESQGEQILIFYNFKHDLYKLKEHIPEAKKLDVLMFQEGAQRIAYAHPASTGHGLNLQVSGAHIIVWYGMTWSLELYQQANARLDRQGQTNTVIVHHLLTEGTLDEGVMKLLSEKDARQDALMEAVKANISKS